MCAVGDPDFVENVHCVWSSNLNTYASYFSYCFESCVIWFSFSVAC